MTAGVSVPWAWMVKVPAFVPSSDPSSKEGAAWCPVPRVTSPCAHNPGVPGAHESVMEAWTASWVQSETSTARLGRDPAAQLRPVWGKQNHSFLLSCFPFLPLSLLPKPVFTYILSSPILKGSSEMTRLCPYIWGQSVAAASCLTSISWRPLLSACTRVTSTHTCLPVGLRVSTAFLVGAGEGVFVFLIPRIVRGWWHPTPVLLPGKSHGSRSLVGCNPWGRKESDTTERLHFHFSLFMHWRRKWQPTPVLLPGESQGRGSLVGCRLWGRTESDTTEAT